MALKEPGTLIYSIARTPERENKFKWVGVIAPADQVYRFDALSNGVNMAFQKDTSDEIVNKFKRALEKIKNNQTYDKILSKYLK